MTLEDVRTEIQDIDLQLLRLMKRRLELAKLHKIFLRGKWLFSFHIPSPIIGAVGMQLAGKCVVAQ